MNGLVGSIGTEKEKAIFPTLNLYQENGKVLVRYEYSDGSLKKLDPSLKGSDETLKIFQESLALPTNNIFPKFDVKNINKVEDSTKKTKPVEKTKESTPKATHNKEPTQFLLLEIQR